MTEESPGGRPPHMRRRAVLLYVAVVGAVFALSFALLYGRVSPTVRTVAVGGITTLAGSMLWPLLREATREQTTSRERPPTS